MKISSPAEGQEVRARKVRVLFVMIHMAMGGSERLVFNLVRNLDKRVFEPSIAWLSQDVSLREFEELGVPLYSVPKRQRVDWRAMRQLAAIVRTHRIEVVNAHHFMPFFYSYYATKVANGARLVYTEHSEADVLATGGKWRRGGGHLIRWSDGAVGISDGVSRALEAHFGVHPSSVRTIANGVDVELFRPGSLERARLRQELGFSRDDVIFGHVANFRHNKNHMFLLRAFSKIARQRSDAKLVLVGQGFRGDPENSEADIVQFIRARGLEASVRILGYRPDVQNLLRMLDVFCLVSYREGLPLSLIEAMASGLPAIGTDIEGIRGVIIPDVSGLLVTPDDVPTLQAALSRLLADAELRIRMGLASRRLAEDRYSLSRCVQQTQDLFLSLAQARTVDVLDRQSRIA